MGGHPEVLRLIVKRVRDGDVPPPSSRNRCSGGIGWKLFVMPGRIGRENPGRSAPDRDVGEEKSGTLLPGSYRNFENKRPLVVRKVPDQV